jgi:hypothetical protein
MTDRYRRFGLQIQPWRNACYTSIERDVVGMAAGGATFAPAVTPAALLVHATR